jgi:DedD protein
VFSNPERARELVNKLTKQGIRAHMETRVHLGPFANREEAEKAQAEMRKLGMQALITPAAATK